MAWKPDYITKTELAAYLRITDSVDDVELQTCVTAASRAIDKHTNRQFGLVAAPETRTYTAWYDYDRCVWMVDVDDFMTITGLVVTVDGTITTDFIKEPRNAAAEGRPWTRLRFIRNVSVLPVTPDYEVDVTATWGWSTVPVPVTLAARVQGARFSIRRDSPYGVAGSPDLGNELRLLSKLDPDVAVSLTDLVRPRRAR